MSDQGDKKQQHEIGAPERLQKVLARAGYGSRRKIEEMILAGRIKVNHEVAQLGVKVASTDQVSIDGKHVHLKYSSSIQRRVMLYHKPEGEVCTRSDEKDRPTVFDRLPSLRHGRWINVGRLDLNSSGLLLFTTDGELANRLMHPSYQVIREYNVRVLGEVTTEILYNLKKGVQLEDGMARFASVKHSGGRGANQWFIVTLYEGRHREVRRLWESQGIKVSRLVRTRYAHLRLPRHLHPGAWMELPPEQVNELSAKVALKKAKKPYKGKKVRPKHLQPKVTHSRKKQDQ